eukprot:TRINITY_DN1532_c0_g1_i1.p1 TRINITY_DN1532_c0_g1~~TRINITY_DN1532_c0_g1_i1.p1  ORF type:complete len:489 (-),score=114.40 TRINITY_DN1532_c0_g1_i1:705-2171(-)
MTSTHVKIQNFINGEFVDPVSGQFIDNIEPATGLVYGQVPDSTSDDVQIAVDAAKDGYSVWSTTPKEERSRIMLKIADLIEADIDNFARAESRDTGKTFNLAKLVDIPRACKNMRFFATAILHHEDMASEIDGQAISYTVSQPIGIAGLISPWNLPLYLLTWKIAPAICVGNSCIAKPSELTSVTAWMFANVCNEAGLPPGVVNFVFGLGPKAGQAIVEHPDIPLLSFTGGTATAEHIIKASAPQYKKLSLELGGKNPNIIFNDANINKCVATTVRSSFANQGEICLCGSRIFVQSGIYDEFVERFLEQVKEWKVGDPNDDTSKMGALISEFHMEKVLHYINLGKEEGRILIGGERVNLEGRCQNGYFVAPTVIEVTDPCCSVMQDEIFGPVVCIMKFETEEEVIELANDVNYGLSATIWTENIGVANRLGMQLEAGTVWVNCWLQRDLRVPFGGRKHSGIGREGGKYSIEFFTEQKTICVNYERAKY